MASLHLPFEQSGFLSVGEKWRMWLRWRDGGRNLQHTTITGDTGYVIS